MMVGLVKAAFHDHSSEHVVGSVCDGVPSTGTSESRASGSQARETTCLLVTGISGMSLLFIPLRHHGDDEAAAKDAAPPGRLCSSGEPEPHSEAGVATSDGRVAAGGPSGSLKALFIGRGTG